METFVVILVLSVAICAADNRNCPDHLPKNSFLYQFGTSCYQFNMGLNTLMNWNDSATDCQEKHGELIDIHSEAEQDFIFSTWKDLRLQFADSFRLWLALNDISTPGIWTWLPGRKEIDFQNWAPGLPGNESGKHCALITLSGQWKDYDCDDLNGWICEFRAATNFDCPANLPRTNNLMSWRDHCYQFNLIDLHGWHYADISCVNSGGYLVDIHSQEEQDFISNSWKEVRIIHPESTAPWIGYTAPWIGLTDGYEEGRWNWTSNDKELDYQNWSPGQPNNLTDLEDCALMEWWPIHGKWHDYPCDEKYGWICKFQKEHTKLT